jgi:hypothetical protein
MNPFIAPLQLAVRSLNLLPGVSASLRTGHVEVEDQVDGGGRRVLVVRRSQDPEAIRRAVAAGRVDDVGAGGDRGAPAPLVRFDCPPDGERATVVVDDPEAIVETGPHTVTVRTEGVERSFDLPFDPETADRRVSNGVVTVDIE